MTLTPGEGCGGGVLGVPPAPSSQATLTGGAAPIQARGRGPEGRTARSPASITAGAPATPEDRLGAGRNRRFRRDRAAPGARPSPPPEDSPPRRGAPPMPGLRGSALRARGPPTSRQPVRGSRAARAATLLRETPGSGPEASLAAPRRQPHPPRRAPA